MLKLAYFNILCYVYLLKFIKHCLTIHRHTHTTAVLAAQIVLIMDAYQSPFIRSLPAGVPLDIIGDVHGEWLPLQHLLHFLGYDEYGHHPHGRKLVFVGDLCDRGTDSPAVLDWTIEAVAKGNAFSVIGNHELNLLINDPKDGSGWFFTERTQDEARYAPWQHYAKHKRQQLTDQLGQWPLILQRDDLRIVHAAWLPESIHKLNEFQSSSLTDVNQYWEHRFHDDFKQTEWYEVYKREIQLLGAKLEDENVSMSFQPGIAHYDLMRSCHNPLRALTSGIQALARAPFYINGRWRFTIRKPWWQHYTDSVAVIIGHYWRSWYRDGVAEHRKELFQEAPTQWLGAKQQVFCVDYSVGARWRERQQSIDPARSRMHLAALRWPEKVIVLDNGQQYLSEQKH